MLTEKTRYWFLSRFAPLSISNGDAGLILKFGTLEMLNGAKRDGT
jgi:hypothetical protein